MLTTTVLFGLLLEGRAARTSDSLGLAALQTALLQDCDVAVGEKSSGLAERRKMAKSFFTIEQLLYWHLGAYTTPPLGDCQSSIDRV